MIIAAGVIGAFTAAVGMYLSFLVDVASGASIVLVGAVLFVLTLGIRAWRQHQRGEATTPLASLGAHKAFD